MFKLLMLCCVFPISALYSNALEYKNFSGIYPHLASSNFSRECGTGAVVPYADKLWFVTYSPHAYFESTDKLYEIDEHLNLKVREESVGGTHANRLIHKESGKLIIGAYIIDKDAKVHAIPRQLMPGRLTGTARHLSDPQNKVYFATMEEALYEYDLNANKVTCIIKDSNLKPDFKTPSEYADFILPRKDGKEALVSKLHGYHGKGLYSGQGSLYYSNNGIRHPDVSKDPTITSGALAFWKEYDADWTCIRENQFTEITSKGGILGANSDTDVLWAMGWDYRSVILALLENGKWIYYRLPKGSHSYDGSHGWNTEWPRIREIGRKDGKFLATMHGTFWNFDSNFSSKNSSGISPRSNYLKVIGDFAKWRGKVVFGCDDTAASEFFNKRPFKAEKLAPGISNSNLWFVDEVALDNLGPVIGSGSVWLRDSVKEGETTYPYLIAGYSNRVLNLVNESEKELRVLIQLDKLGDNNWEDVKEFLLPANSDLCVNLDAKNSEGFYADNLDLKGVWVRLKALTAMGKFSAQFSYSNKDKRGNAADKIFEGFENKGGLGSYICVKKDKNVVLGVQSFAVKDGEFEAQTYYELDKGLNLKPAQDANFSKLLIENKPNREGVKFEDSKVLVSEGGKEYILPVNPNYDSSFKSDTRLAREISTERDIFMASGIVYELPAQNAQGMAKIRAVSTADFAFTDFCSFRGMMVLSGVDKDAKDSEHIIKSTDGKTALWLGTIDDLWKLGKARGFVGVYKNQDVAKDTITAPILMRGFDKKTISIKSEIPLQMSLEFDIDGTGVWIKKLLDIPEGGINYTLPENFTAYWLCIKTLGNAKNLDVKIIYE